PKHGSGSGGCSAPGAVIEYMSCGPCSTGPPGDEGKWTRISRPCCTLSAQGTALLLLGERAPRVVVGDDERSSFAFARPRTEPSRARDHATDSHTPGRRPRHGARGHP